MHRRLQSLLALRLCADYHMYVLCDEVKAKGLAEEAERIEGAQAREENAAGASHLRLFGRTSADVMGDNVAIITIGAAAGNIGNIISANGFTSKLFGYPRWQLERRNVSMLMPPPLSTYHDSFLKHYADTGEGSYLDYTRVVIGL